MCSLVGRVAGERAESLRHLGRGRVALAGHDRGHRAGEGAGLVGVVRHAAHHQHRAEVGVAETERAEVVGEPGDLLARELRHQHADLEHDRPEPDRVPVAPRCRTAPVSTSKNLSKFRLARLQAVLSRNMYSEHGLLALMRPALRAGVPSLMVVSYCTPGSARARRRRRSCCQRSRALTVLGTSPSVRQVRFQSPSSSTALKKSLVTRTELFEFWPETVA